MDIETAKLIDQVRQAAEAIGHTQGEWQALCDELNRKGIKTRKGLVWTRNNLIQFCKRYDLFSDAPRTDEQPDLGMTVQAEGSIIQANEGTTERMTQDEPTPTDDSMTPESDQGMTQDDQYTAYPEYEDGSTDLETVDTEHVQASVDGMTSGNTPGNTELEALIAGIVRRELRQLLTGEEPGKGQESSQAKDSKFEKKTFSLPPDVWRRLEALGGKASQHVTRALRIYLDMKEATREE